MDGLVESSPAGLTSLQHASQPTDTSPEGNLTSLWLLYNQRTVRNAQMRDKSFVKKLFHPNIFKPVKSKAFLL